LSSKIEEVRVGQEKITVLQKEVGSGSSSSISSSSEEEEREEG